MGLSQASSRLPELLSLCRADTSCCLTIIALITAFPLVSKAQEAGAARPAFSESLSTGGSRSTLRGVIIAARDITRASPVAEASTVPRADPCAGRASVPDVPQVAPAAAPAFRALPTDDAAARYRNLLAAQGKVVQEGVARPRLEDVVSPFIGRPLDASLTADVSGAVVAYLNSHASALSDVYFPAQDASDGVLVLVVAPAKLGKIITKGQQHTRGDDLACRIRVAPGGLVDPATVARDLAHLNSNPWRHTEAAFTPGAALGETDIVLTTVDERPLRVFAGADNAGSRITGLARYRAGFSVGNPFGLFDHRLDYTYLSAANRRRLNGHLLGYTLPLGASDTLSASASYFRTDAELQGGVFQSSGSNSTASLQWNRTLDGGASGARARAADIHAGAEYKRVGSALAFNQESISNIAPVVLQGYVGTNASWTDSLGGNALGARFTLSPGGLAHRNSDATFNNARIGARSDYARLNLSYERYLALAQSGPLKGWQLHGRLVGQWADKPLIASERFGLSGAQGVRGYYEDTLFADRGLVANLELQTPFYRVAPAGKEGFLQGFVFVDAGRAWNQTPELVADLAAQARTTHNLVSHGLGIRFNLGQTLTLRADVGWRHIGLRGKQGALGHISATVAY